MRTTRKRNLRMDMASPCVQSAHMPESRHVTASLKKLREAAGLSVREMARRVGMSPSGYSHYESPSRFKSDYLPMAEAINFSAALEESGIARDDVMALALSSTTPALPAPVENGHSGPPGTALVAVYDISASAGGGALVQDYEAVSHSLAFPPDYLSRLTRSNPKNLAIISVKGDSMVPTLHDDDIVMLDHSKTSLAYDGLFVVRFWDALHVKRISRGSRADTILIISDNKEHYPPQELPAEEVQVIGKVIWGGGKM